MVKNRIEMAIALILQERRDRIFKRDYDVDLGNIYKLKRGLKLEEKRKHTTKNFKDFWFFLLLEQMLKLHINIKQNDHVYNQCVVVGGEGLGLSHFEEAIKDCNYKSSSKDFFYIYLSLIFEIRYELLGPKIKREIIFGEDLEFMRKDQFTKDECCNRGWIKDLIDCITEQNDPRLDFEHITDYLRENYQEDVKKAAEELLEKKPVLQTKEDKLEEYTKANICYIEAQKTFLCKYLPHVLYDLDFLIFETD
jgi:hypothetical protein